MIVALYGILSYFYFFYVFLAAMAFTFDAKTKFPQVAHIFPWTINGPMKNSNVQESLMVDAVLLGIFAIQHLIMARKFWKKIFNGIFPESSERSTFVLAATAALHAMMVYWHPVNDVVWSFPKQFDNIFAGVWAFGWVTVLLATFNIDHFELFGLRQCTGLTVAKPQGFVATYLYKYIRHPIMTGFLIAFWTTRVMTVGHLLFAGMCTGFIIFTVFLFEEPDLVKDIGHEYVDYKKKVPAFCPIPGMSWAAARSAPKTMKAT
jgi:protein-S-isoprenylcysteine O-methyltransferase Ste14